MWGGKRSPGLGEWRRGRTVVARLGAGWTVEGKGWGRLLGGFGGRWGVWLWGGMVGVCGRGA